MSVVSPSRTAAGLAVLLCAGVVAIAFAAGGYFAGTTGLAEAAAASAVAIWVVASPAPTAGWSVPLGIAVASLAGFALWALLSAGWSHAPARAAIEADRALLYALVVALAGMIGAVPRVRAAAQLGLVGALAFISVAGLVTRLLPQVWAAPAGMELERLSYPVGYWNALGAIGALALIGCVHLAADDGRPRPVRSAAAGAVPLVAASIVLTFSRGGIAVALGGVLLVLVLARSPGCAAALVACVPTAALAVAAVLGSDAVVAAARHPGPAAAIIVGGCAAAAATGQAALHHWRPWSALPRPGLLRPIAGALVVLAIGGLVATGAAGAVIDRAGRLTQSSHVVETGDERARLTQLSDNGRIDAWRVSLRAFTEAPLHGSGAGTFALSWDKDRPGIQEINDGHSLLFESLGELGLVGAGLLVLGLAALGRGVALGLRGPDRPSAALGLAVLVAWLVHACMDWDWEMPALTLPALAIAALAAGRAGEPSPRRARGARAARAVAVAAMAAIALVGAGLALSQRDVDTAIAAVHAGHCPAAEDAARAAQRYGGGRPEPHVVLSVCALRTGDSDLALTEMHRAIVLDPGNWRLVYDLAVMRAFSGRDPRPTMRHARQLNPNSWLLRIAARELGGRGPDAWRQAAARADLLV
jgi:hypothetical protein